MHQPITDSTPDPGHWISRIDARLKLAALVIGVAWASLMPARWCLILIPLLGLTLAVVLLARLPMRRLLGSWMKLMPILLFLAVWHPLIDQRPAMLWVFGWHLPISRGWTVALAIVLGVSLIYWMTMVTVATTPFVDLLRGLRWYGLPVALVSQLGFIHRYLPTVQRRVGELLDARRLRDGGRGDWRFNLGSWGRLLGVFFVRSWDDADRIYEAMAARGFAGPRPVARTEGKARVWAMTATGLLLALTPAALRWWLP